MKDQQTEKPDLASIKVEKGALKEAKKICLDKEINLYEYVTAALLSWNRRKLREKSANVRS